MAFFKFRKGEGESVATPSQSESVEAMRRRARQRLIGASVLVLAGVIGFPLLFDTQPRPVAVDIPIEIPDRQKAPPLAVPAPASSAAPAPAPTPAASAAPKAEAPVAPVTAAAPAPPAAAGDASRARPATSVEAKADTRAASAAARAAAPVAPAAVPDEGARARALLDGQPPAAVDGRFVVQVGAYSDAGKAREVRQKLERAGVKTYVHVAETKEGSRIRVRAGPFASRSEADKAAQKIKGLDLPASVLSL
jgi:DedD protein